MNILNQTNNVSDVSVNTQEMNKIDNDFNFITEENVKIFFDVNNDFLSGLDIFVQYDSKLSPYENMYNLNTKIIEPLMRPDYVVNISDTYRKTEKHYNDLIKSMLEQSWIGNYNQKNNSV